MQTDTTVLFFSVLNRNVSEEERIDGSGLLRVRAQRSFQLFGLEDMLDSLSGSVCNLLHVISKERAKSESGSIPLM